MTARRTQLGRRKEPVQLKIGSPRPSGLIFKFAEYFTKRRVNNMPGQRMILCHSGNVQPFHKDRLVLAGDLRRKFLKRIAPGIADSGMEFSDFEFRLIAVIAAFRLARHSALKPFQSFYSSQEWTGIFYLLAVAGSRQRFNPHVYADFGFGFLQWPHVGLDQDADKIASGRITAHSQAKQPGIVRQWAAPRDI